MSESVEPLAVAPKVVAIQVYGERQPNGSYRVYIAGCGFLEPYNDEPEAGFPRAEWTYPDGRTETILLGVFKSGCLDTRYAILSQPGNYGVTVTQYDEAGKPAVTGKGALALA